MKIKISPLLNELNRTEPYTELQPTHIERISKFLKETVGTHPLNALNYINRMNDVGVNFPHIAIEVRKNIHDRLQQLTSSSIYSLSCLAVAARQTGLDFDVNQQQKKEMCESQKAVAKDGNWDGFIRLSANMRILGVDDFGEFKKQTGLVRDYFGINTSLNLLSYAKPIITLEIPVSDILFRQNKAFQALDKALIGKKDWTTYATAHTQLRFLGVTNVGNPQLHRKELIDELNQLAEEDDWSQYIPHLHNMHNLGLLTPNTGKTRLPPLRNFRN